MNECRERIIKMLMDTGVTEGVASDFVETMILDICSAYSYEQLDEKGFNWHELFKQKGFHEPIEKLMMERNHWVAKLIAPRLLPGDVMDHDSGDSYVAHLIQSDRPDVKVHTQDAFDFRTETTDLPFSVYDYDEKKLPYPDGTHFDNVILATVLHHCDEPEKMFDEVVSFLRQGGRLFLFENVFTRGDLTERGVNVFFDWFFNKIFHRSGLPLPFQHLCVEQWKKFLEWKGFDIIEAQEHLGHWPSIPLEHILYVATKR